MSDAPAPNEEARGEDDLPPEPTTKADTRMTGPLAWMARQRFYRKSVLVPASLAIAAVALVWLVERTAAA